MDGPVVADENLSPIHFIKKGRFFNFAHRQKKVFFMKKSGKRKSFKVKSVDLII